MPNEQPFYHRAVVLFTATRPMDKAQFKRLVKSALARKGVVIQHSVEIEEFDEPESGDPADLL